MVAKVTTDKGEREDRERDRDTEKERDRQRDRERRRHRERERVFHLVLCRTNLLHARDRLTRLFTQAHNK